MRNNRYGLLIIVMTVVASSVKAQNEDIFTNPAMRSFQSKVSLTEVSVGYDERHATTPIRLEQGDGHSRVFANVEAYQHNGKATLWGEAFYSKGSTRNIQFCETSDFELLYPYIMADTVGGKSQQERYRFLGGFSYPLGQRWQIGAEGSYSALMEYRTRDPRPKNLTGDLKAQFAVSYRVGKEQNGYVLALAMHARKYKQTNELKLYNEVSTPIIYHLTGLGNDYYRFRGMNTSTYYKGYGVGGAIDWSRGNQMGWFAHAEYGYLDIDKIISSLNELPMANIKEYREKISFGYRVGNQRNIFGYHLSEEWTRRRGRENIFGTAQDNVYPRISTIAPYLANKVCLSTEVGFKHIFRNLSEYSCKWNLRYDSWDETYESPVRELSGNVWGMVLTLGGKVNVRDWQWIAHVAGEYQWGPLHDLYISDKKEANAALMKPIRHYYDYLRHDRKRLDAMVEADYAKCKRFTPFFRVGWQYAAYMKGEHQNCLVASVGVKF